MSDQKHRFLLIEFCRVMSPILESVYRTFSLTDEELSQIMSEHDKISVDKGDYLLREGAVSNEYYIVEEGLLRSYAIDYQGDERTVDFFATSDVAIEVLSLFQRVPTVENIVAVTDCTLWRIDFMKFQQLFHTIPNFMEWGRAWMSGNLFYQKQRSISLITQSATDRYLALLKEKPMILQHAPLKYIASYLGVTDTSLSRIRKEVASMS